MIPSIPETAFEADLGRRMPKPGYKAYFESTGETGVVTWVGEGPGADAVEIEIRWEDGSVDRYGYYSGLLFQELVGGQNE